MRIIGGIITIVEGVLLAIVFGKSINDDITRDMVSVVMWIVFLGIILVATGIIGLVSRKKIIAVVWFIIGGILLILPGAASNQVYIIQIPFFISMASILAGILFLASLSGEKRMDKNRWKAPTEEETKQNVAEYFKRISKGE
ncbi:hypothetical protein IA51_08215 [Listeria monocytogenes]|uniref:hypothetical protein n=1 Tax=Listeria monocytogenes TaxID=1639 RepID=UPI0010D7DB32|nr:hypothetical protein [Listeria monocytogenes]EAC8104889.1 hypothetical protein [Listeria monocytogenes]EAC9079181.1 hypothetical protein [Listeria monocytogenes]EKF1562457.1 hypothetical protein [Listeria monocytogenes]